MAIVRALDPVALRADFPIFDRDFGGRQLAYLDSAATALKPRVVADAMNDYLTALQRQRPPRRLRDRRGGDGGLRGSARQDRELHRRREPARDRDGPQRDRGDQPRRLRVGPAQHRQGRHDRRDRAGAPLEHRSVAAAHPGEGRGPRVRALRRGGAARPGVLRGAAAHEAQVGGVHPGQQRHRHHQPGPRDGRQGTRGRRAGARRRRPGRASSAGQRPGAGLRLLRLLAATRRSARQVPAHCGRGARSWRRCRRSWVVAR